MEDATLSVDDRAVVRSAAAIAAIVGSNPNHTVGAAAMDSTGRIHSAVNVFHFTGGPCAELVAVGVAATAKAGPLLTIAAVGDDGRGVIPPCGRCRQVLLDLHPDVHVVIPTPSGLIARPVRKLLPDAYAVAGGTVRRVVRFDNRYFDSIAAGQKVVTVRWDDPIDLGPALFAFEGDEQHRTLDGVVTDVTHCALGDLTEELIEVDPGSSVAEYIAGLHDRYTEMPRDAVVEVVTFEVV